MKRTIEETFKKTIRPLFNKLGLDVIKLQNTHAFPLDFTQKNIDICNAVAPFTMTTRERINALIYAVEYIIKNNIEGDFVECGVWKGGSSMVIALTLQKLGITDRNIYLYDTYTGMSEPTDADVFINGQAARQRFETAKLTNDTSSWCYSSLDEVKTNMHSTGYPKDKLHFIKGKVENTIPATLPNKTALLRLDTDFYESTKHELIHLFPLLCVSGVLIIDDYGDWAGSQKATDEYIKENNVRILLNRIDCAARLGIKT